MTPRSKKYYQKRKEDSGDKKGSASNAGYNEESGATFRQQPKANPAPSKAADDPQSDTLDKQSNL